MDFYRIKTKSAKDRDEEWIDISPDFVVGHSEDLMVRAGAFYAIWDEARGIWSTNEYDVARLVDEELYKYMEENFEPGEARVKSMRSFDSQSWTKFKKFCNSLSNSYVQLDEDITFADQDVVKEDYVSKKLPYALEPGGDHSAWDELVGTLYFADERAKIEYAIGCLIAGDSKRLQKFFVWYGAPGTGKGTVLNIIHKMFYEYTAVFEAKALASNNNSFATEAFKNNPLLALQHDGDLSRIEDNTKLNSIVSHEAMLINEKYKSGYMARLNALLILGTNQPVKISDARSGIIRRLIDVNPSGNRLASKKYLTLLKKIDFEYGAIAAHCLEVYKHMGFHYYDAYRPTEMMYKTDAFFNFVEAHYDIFAEGEGISLKRAWSLYKEYCDEAKLKYSMQMNRFREELKDYFKYFEHRKTMEDGSVVTSWFAEFDKTKFNVVREVPTEEVEEEMPLLEMNETESIFDEVMAHQPAQYASRSETPSKKWSEVDTTLEDLNTKRIHYVKVPENHIVIDFDLRDDNGDKSFERNREAASLWPRTYAEVSKSGEGIHLHYNYVGGDLDRLDPLFAENVEVKVYRGDSSLRRRLTKCNNVPVADISSGLPLKEKTKVLSEKRIKSEKGLRDLIERNLRKEILPGTYSSVSFIKKVLDDAYEDGLVYDVTNMRHRIIVFANNSTNQKMKALQLVQQMKFVGAVSPEDNFGDDPVSSSDYASDKRVFYDVEVYKNLFVVCWKIEDAPEESVVRWVNPTPDDMERLMKMKLVGFNNRRYDNHIIYARYMGYNNLSLYNLSQAIIDGKRDAMFASAYGLSYADIYDFSSKKQSLKKFMIDLGILKVEMDIPWDQEVPEDKIEKIVDYCVNDVIGTEAVWKSRQADFRARQILAELSGLTVNDTTQKHTARILFGQDRNPQSKFKYTDLSEIFPGYTFEPTRKPKSDYKGEDPSEGGYVYAEPGMYENVAVLDVASMHPTSIIELNAFGDYTPKFKDLLDARLAIKSKNYTAAKKMLDGRLAPYLGDEKEAKELSYALKIVINIVYGLTSASFDNPFRDIRNRDNIVAKRGALFMIELKHWLQEQGVKVVHIKTDSIKIPNATPELIRDVQLFGEKYGYTFEHEATYDKFCLVNDAVYIAHYGWAEDEEKIGTWDAVGAQFQHSYVYKTLFSGEDLTFDDFCEPKNVVKGAIYMDYKHDTPDPTVERMQFVGKIGLFVPVTDKSNGAILYCYRDEKLYAVAGTKGFLWQEASKADRETVDMRYFDKLNDAAIKTIEKFGSYDAFVK